MNGNGPALNQRVELFVLLSIFKSPKHTRGARTRTGVKAKEKRGPAEEGVGVVPRRESVVHYPL